MDKKKLYILTSEKLPNLYYDDKKLIEEFKQQGYEIEVVVWDNAYIPDHSLVLIRTIWDYPLKRNTFLELLSDFEKRNVKTINDVSTIKWNLDKSYLVELYDKGASVVKTEIKHNFKLEDLAKKKFPLVVKPLVGASGRNTFCLEHENFNQDINALVGEDVLIQPFVSSIKTIGEYSFIFFGGKFSHGIIKTPKDGEFRIQEEHGGHVKKYEPSNEELVQVKTILAFLKYPCLYARVDVVKVENKFELMELELIEPELFFRFSENGERKLIEALS